MPPVRDKCVVDHWIDLRVTRADHYDQCAHASLSRLVSLSGGVGVFRLISASPSLTVAQDSSVSDPSSWWKTTLYEPAESGSCTMRPLRARICPHSLARASSALAVTSSAADKNGVNGLRFGVRGLRIVRVRWSGSCKSLCRIELGTDGAMRAYEPPW